MKRYDIIIAGGGMAGLSLCYYLSQSPLRNSSILLIDREPKDRNDRTWCFWESEPGPFESILFRSWQQVAFVGKTASRLLPLGQSTYKMLRGIDFYAFARTQLANLPNLHIEYATVNDIHETAGGGVVRAGNTTYLGRYVFDSVSPLSTNRPGTQHSLQHFKGWVITTEYDCFDVSAPRIMDFRVPQLDDCRFFYLLPFDKRTALIEYTVFGQQVLADAEYTDALRRYISTFIDTGGYRIQETERGVIPMTDELPPVQPGGHVLRIGMAGGYTRPSTGYTFQRTQECLRGLVDNWVKTGTPTLQTGEVRSWVKRALDTVFLNVLIHHRFPAVDLFTRLFTHNKPAVLFRFMNEESTFWEDLQVINSMPKRPFVLAALDSLLTSVMQRTEPVRSQQHTARIPKSAPTHRVRLDQVNC
ncbi:lycopene cyclase family protein [Fibrella sp. ES10-3-2-2]